MAHIEKKIEEWIRADLLSRKAADGLLTYEARKPAGSWVLNGFLILGAVTVGIGIISLIAANWDAIPPSAKLTADFILLSALAFGVFKTHVQGKSGYFEMVLVAFQITCLATIGLISQIYNTGGEVYQALLAWSLITAGVAVASKNAFAPFLWASGFFTALLFAGLQTVWLAPIFSEHYPALVLALSLLGGLMAMVCRAKFGENAQTQALRVWSLMAFLMSLLVVETINAFNFKDTGINFIAYYPGYVLVFLLAIAVISNKNSNRLQNWVSLLALILFVASFHYPYLGIKSDIVFAVSTLSVLTLLALLMASLRQRKIFQVLVVLIGIRFLILYFQALGGLATTGVGLIASGALIIFLVSWWNKKRQAIANWAEGLLT